MATVVPNSFKGRMLGDTSQIGTAINFATDTFKGMLLTSSHTQDADAHVFIDDVSANEVAASGAYSAGGVTLSLTSSTDNTENEGELDAVDITITGFTGSAQYFAIYKDTGTPSTSPIFAIYDFGSVISSTAGTFSVPINANGLITLA